MQGENKTELATLCAGCRHGKADGSKFVCNRPDMEKDIWAYVEPRIETLGEVQAALSVCDQATLQKHEAAPHVAAAVTALSGTCDYYESETNE